MSSPSSHNMQQHQVPVQRVLQLDAIRFDDDLLATFERRLQRHLLNTLFYINSRPSPTTLRFILRLIHFLHTTLLNRPTPGHSLQDLSFTRLSLVQRLVHLIVDIVLPYVVTTYPTKRALGFLYALALLCVRCRFVCNGQGVTLGHLLSGSYVAYNGNLAASRSLLFQLVDRQLVWQGLAELALCVSPVVKSLLSSHIFSLSYILHVMRGGRSRSGGGGVAAANDNVNAASRNNNDDDDDDNVRRTNQGKCVFCERNNHINMPHRLVPCGCVACYVCLHINDVFACPVCMVTFSDVQRITC